MQFLIHYSLHLIFPCFLAYWVFRKHWKKAYGFMLATMLVDVDHLWASPIYQADRCSIDFHTFHQYEVMPVYVALLFFKKPWRWIGLGLSLHMLTDYLDCCMM
ncbi:MAG: DUF6122 family protein [Bacteroidota bacterium]